MKPILRRLIAAIAIVGSVAAAFIVGIYYGIESDPRGDFPAGTLFEIKASARKMAGLPKKWSLADGDPSDDIQLPCPANPLVVVTGGQSNAANAISTPLEADPASHAYMFFRGKCYAIRDPLLGASGTRGSVWSRLGPMLAKREERPVVFVNGAIGGSQYGDWLESGSPYMGWLRDRVADAAKVVGPADIILWHQGETDAFQRPAQAEIQAQIAEVTKTALDSFALKPGAKLVLYRASICTGERRKKPTPAIIAAQTAVAASDPRIVAGPDTDRLGLRYRHDDCHLNDTGAIRMAEQTLALIDPLLKAH